MDIPPNHIWPEGSAAGQPYPPGSGEPAHPVLDLFFAVFISGPCLIGLLVLAIVFGFFEDLGAVEFAVLLLGAGVWGLLVAANIKSAREAMNAIRRRRREKRSVEDSTKRG